MIVVGIDPGLDGAVVVLGKEISVYDTPSTEVIRNRKKRREYDVQSMVKIIEQLPADSMVSLEWIHSMPGEGVVSAFSFGHGLGLWKGILASRKIPYQMVTPQAWKKTFSLIGTEKDAARLTAQQLFPTVDLSMKKYGGRADALLIGEHLRRVLDKPLKTKVK